MTETELKPVIKGHQQRSKGINIWWLKDNSWLTILSIADGSVFGNHAVLVAATGVVAPCW